MTRLLTDRQLCEQYGIPSPRTVRTMRQQGLPSVRLGRAYLFDAAYLAPHAGDLERASWR